MGGPPVLFLSYSGVLGGAERVLLDCAVRLGRPVLLACPEGELAAAARGAGLAVEQVPRRSLRLRGARGAALRGVAGLAADASRLTRLHRPAALVAWSARAVLAAALARTGATPVVAVHHDFPPGRRVAGALRRATGRAGAVVATSRAVAEALELGGAATILHPGVDLAAWTPLPPPPPGPPRALVLGALVPWKRADLALDVAARLPDLRLTIAGAPIDGEDAHAAVLHERAGAADLRDRVEFAGRVSDPRTVLAGAHLLLHCADAEPFGLVLVEAMAAGRPVVAAGAGGPLEIVGDVGGRLFAPGDAAAAAAAVRAVLADPGAGPGARRRAEDFPVEASAARLAAAIAAVAP